MKTKSTQLDTYMQGVFVVVLQVVILLATFFVTTITFAQEEEILITSQQIEEVEVLSEESIDKEMIQAIEETSLVESELTKEQEKQIAELDRLLKQEKITQEEYDKRKEEIISTTLTEEESLIARSALEVEPEAQTLGKYIAPTVSTTNGSLNYSYPIIVPPGRNGLTPDIALTYNSNNKSQSSLVGIGWSFNIPYIQRINKTGTNNLYSDNYFTSSLDGELIDQGNGVYTPRIENGTFHK